MDEGLIKIMERQGGTDTYVFNRLCRKPKLDFLLLRPFPCAQAHEIDTQHT